MATSVLIAEPVHSHCHGEYRTPTTTKVTTSNSCDRGKWKRRENLLSEETFKQIGNLLDRPLTFTNKPEYLDGNVISTQFKLRDFLSRLVAKIDQFKIGPKRNSLVKLVGTGATFFLVQNLTNKHNEDLEQGEDSDDPDLSNIPYNLRCNTDICKATNDIDIAIELNGGRVNFSDVMYSQEEIIAEMIYAQTGVRFSLLEVYKIFVRDSIKIDGRHAKWSLFSIGTDNFSIDIQVVEKSKRSYAFSIDSFEILLNPYLSRSKSSKRISVESAYGDYAESVKHLLNNQIHTRSPEYIYRGIFRYVLERAKGRRPIDGNERDRLEKVFIAQMLEEFGDCELGIEFFGQTLMKFINKHKKEKSKILAEMSRTIERNEDRIGEDLTCHYLNEAWKLEKIVNKELEEEIEKKLEI